MFLISKKLVFEKGMNSRGMGWNFLNYYISCGNCVIIMLEYIIEMSGNSVTLTFLKVTPYNRAALM